MSLISRLLRRTFFCIVWMVCGLCAAQQTRFSAPAVVATGNWPANVGAGVADATGKLSLVSCDAYIANATLACHLYANVQGVWTATQNYSLPGATAAKAVIVADPVLGLNGVAILSVQPSSPSPSSILVAQFYANGTGTPQTAEVNAAGGAGPVPPDFAYRPASTAGSQPGLLIATDSANGYFYVLTVGPSGLASSTMTALMSSLSGPVPSQAGTILPNLYPTSGTHGLRPAFGVVSTDGSSVGMVLMNPDGTWSPIWTSSEYTGSGNVYSAVLADMDGDGIADLVAEGANGRIDIYHGNPDGSFATASEGGTGTANGLNGTGGRLVGVEPGTLNILTATPIGLSVLVRQNGTLTYGLQGIYNIGPGRSSFALADLYGTGMLDLAVDSPEGIAIVLPDANGDGGFQTSRAYAALAPALGAVVGKFRDAANPNGNLDVAVATGAVQAQLLTGNGDGTFAAFGAQTNPAGGPTSIPAAQWSNLLAGDFNGDGVADLAYSLTGYPIPGIGLLAPGANPGLYVQLGNGDGTFQTPQALNGASSDATLYGESAVGDFNGDGLADLANTDWRYSDVLLAQSGGFNASVLARVGSSGSFSPVAAGFLKTGRSNKQDLVVSASGALYVYVNNNGSGFTAMPKILTAIGPSTVLLTDMDGDGNGDIVLLTQVSDEASKPNQMFIWWGNGDGTFSAAPLFFQLSRNFYLGAAADINGDGLADMVLSDGDVVAVLYNQGGRAFGGEQDVLAGQGINSITLADVNGDGKPDVIVANGGVTNSNAITQLDDLPLTGLSSIALAANPVVNTGGITVLLNNLTKPDTGSLTVSPEPTLYGATFTLTATLTPSPNASVPTGTVQFSVDGTNAGNPVTLVAGAGSSSAVLVVPSGNTYSVGAHVIDATYAGDAANSPIALSTTHNVQLVPTTSQIFMCIGPTVACPAPPAAPATQPPYTSALTMYYGQIWNGFFDAYANDGSALTGNLNMLDAYTGPDAPPPNPLCSVLAGVAGACPNSVGTTEGTSVGLNVLTADYPGDATHAASTSGPIAITVLPDLTSQPTLAGAPNPSPLGQAVTFTATLTGNYAAPTGPVQFIETFPPTATVVLLGSANLVPGTGLTSTATFTTTTLPLGTDTITAGYAATQNFGAATFPTITETITPSLAGSFTLSVTPNPASVGVGYSTLLTVTVTPQNGFVQSVNLACANLPNEASCFFDSSTLTNGGGSTSLVVGTSAPHTCGTDQPYFLGQNGGGAGRVAWPALAGLAALLLPGRRRWLRGLIALAAVAALTQMTGCSTCTDLGTRPATYTFQVTGTAAGTGEVQAQPVTITVTI